MSANEEENRNALPASARGDDATLPPDLADRVRSFRLIVFLAQRLRARMDERLRVDDLTTQQAALITVIDSLGEPTLGEAAAMFGSSHQNVRQIADVLVRKGFIEITADATDQRRRRLRPTDRSAAYWESRNESDFRAVAEWFGKLDDSEAAELVRLLDLLATDMQRD